MDMLVTSEKWNTHDDDDDCRSFKIDFPPISRSYLHILLKNESPLTWRLKRRQDLQPKMWKSIFTPLKLLFSAP